MSRASKTGLKSCVNWLDYGARMYDTKLGRWFNIDPLADISHSLYLSPYSYCANNPIKYIDPNGMDYFINRNTGNVVKVESLSRGAEDDMESGWEWYGPNEMLIYRSGVEKLRKQGYFTDYDYCFWRGIAKARSNGGSDWTYRAGYSLSGSGLAFNALQNTVTPGKMWLGNNGKYYSNTWGGNQYTGSRAGAFKAAGIYKMAGRANVAATVIIGGVSVYNGYQQDGGQFGYNVNRAGAAATGGIIGGWAGAKAGAAIGMGIGAFFFGAGAVPGAVIGGIIGGFVGSLSGNAIGAEAVDYYYER